MEFGTLLRPDGVMNLIRITSHPVNVLRREPYLGDFVEQILNAGSCSDMLGLISFKLGMVMGTTKLYNLISS